MRTMTSQTLCEKLQTQAHANQPRTPLREFSRREMLALSSYTNVTPLAKQIVVCKGNGTTVEEAVAGCYEKIHKVFPTANAYVVRGPAYCEKSGGDCYACQFKHEGWKLSLYNVEHAYVCEN